MAGLTSPKSTSAVKKLGGIDSRLQPFTWRENRIAGTKTQDLYYKICKDQKVHRDSRGFFLRELLFSGLGKQRGAIVGTFAVVGSILECRNEHDISFVDFKGFALLGEVNRDDVRSFLKGIRDLYFGDKGVVAETGGKSWWEVRLDIQSRNYASQCSPQAVLAQFHENPSAQLKAEAISEEEANQTTTRIYDAMTRIAEDFNKRKGATMTWKGQASEERICRESCEAPASTQKRDINIGPKYGKLPALGRDERGDEVGSAFMETGQYKKECQMPNVKLTEAGTQNTIEWRHGQATTPATKLLRINCNLPHLKCQAKKSKCLLGHRRSDEEDWEVAIKFMDSLRAWEDPETKRRAAEAVVKRKINTDDL